MPANGQALAASDVNRSHTRQRHVNQRGAG